jgi:hypothetical protein
LFDIKQNLGVTVKVKCKYFITKPVELQKSYNNCVDREYYNDFVVGSFSEYLNNMRRESTYGDNLTFLALSRDLNCQFLVLNSEGLGHHRLISNSGVYDKDIRVYILGYYPEDNGEHYVSLSVGYAYIKHLLSRFRKNNDSATHLENYEERLLTENSDVEQASADQRNTLILTEQSQNVTNIEHSDTDRISGQGKREWSEDKDKNETEENEVDVTENVESSDVNIIN